MLSLPVKYLNPSMANTKEGLGHNTENVAKKEITKKAVQSKTWCSTVHLSVSFVLISCFITACVLDIRLSCHRLGGSRDAGAW